MNVSTLTLYSENSNYYYSIYAIHFIATFVKCNGKNTHNHDPTNDTTTFNIKRNKINK